MVQLCLFNTDYVSKINHDLNLVKTTKYTVLDLFAGCGSLSLGFELLGFQSTGFESNSKCCDTYNSNLKGEC